MNQHKRLLTAMGLTATILAGMMVATPVQATPISWQTTPADRHVNWDCSQPAGPLTLGWALNEAVPAGTWLRVRATGLHCLGKYDIKEYGYTGDGMSGTVPIAEQYTREDQRRRWMFYVHNPYLVAGPVGRDLPAGTTITTAGQFQRLTVAGNHFMYRIEAAESFDGPWRCVSPWTVLDTTAGPATSLEVYWRGTGVLHGVYLDELGNPATVQGRTVTLRAPPGAVLQQVPVDDAATFAVAIGDDGDAFYRVQVSDSAGLEAVSTARPEGFEPGTAVYFGDIHWHTEYSGDGHRPIRDSLSSARDEMGHDFTALGDHMGFYQGYTPEDYFDTLDAFNEPGRFATILGYEISTGMGHFNPYYRDRAAAAKYDAAIADLNRNKRLTTERYHLVLSSWYRHFEPDEIVVVPHHMNTTSGAVVTDEGLPFWTHFDWREVDDRYTRVAELIQERGCWETEATDPDWIVKNGGYGASVRTALARGLRFGFVAGSDNHQGWPSRLQAGKGYSALTGMVTHELTREALFEAMRQRRTYATSGVRIVLDVMLNDTYPMGSEVKLHHREPRNFHIRVRGTAPLERAEIVSQGATLATLELSGGADLETVWSDTRPDRPLDDCYYYLRVRQTDGNCAWSSPIWVDYDLRPATQAAAN